MSPRLKELFFEAAPDYGPDNDPWGHAMGVYFAVASILFFQYGALDPEHNYRPGAARGPDMDDYAVQALMDPDLAVTEQELQDMARLCRILTARLERMGRSY